MQKCIIMTCINDEKALFFKNELNGTSLQLRIGFEKALKIKLPTSSLRIRITYS